MESADKLIDLADKQGVHVATIVLVLFLVGATLMLWRKLNARDDMITVMRDEFDEDLTAERTRHAIEIAAERKLNAELQETRLLETRSAMEAIQKVTVTIQNATDAVKYHLGDRAKEPQIMALRDWFKPRKSAPPKHRSRSRTRDVVIVNEVKAAELPNTQLAEQSKRAQVGLIQSILNMERQASDLNKSLVELTLKNFSGGRS